MDKKILLESGRYDTIDKKYINDFNNIHWNLTENCNYNCKYCFRYNHKTTDFLPKNKYIEIINYIKNSGIQFTELTLIGGEPTYNPNIELITNMLSQCSNIEHLILFTNGFNLDYLYNINLKLNKFMLFISYHSEFEDNDIFFNKIKKLAEHNFNIHVFIMLENNIEKITDIQNRLYILSKQYKNLNIETKLIFYKYNVSTDIKKLYDDEEKNSKNTMLVYYKFLENDKIFYEYYNINDIPKLSSVYSNFQLMECSAFRDLEITTNGYIQIRCDYKTKYFYLLFIFNEFYINYIHIFNII